MKSEREINGYRIIRPIGRGGMSEVYEAEHIRLGSRHALKLFAYTGSDPDVRGRFISEGELLLRIRHPRIVRVSDTGFDPESGNPYFIMDLVTDPEGEIKPLAKVAPGSVEESVVGMWYDDIRDGLAHIHAMNVIHRDLKLENVLIGSDGHAVLTDFGISKITAESISACDVVKTVARMRNGTAPVMGSVGYLAPELELGVSASRESDYYALGVMIFRLLTATWCDLRTNVAGLLDGYDPAWSEILPKLLHSNPRGRECPSWREIKERNINEQAFIAEEQIEKLQKKLSGSKKSFTVSIIAVAVLAMIAAFGILHNAAHTPVPTFEDLFYIPDDAPEDAEQAKMEKRSSREDLEKALPDAWVVTQDVFSNLRNGIVSEKKTILALDRLAYRAHRNDKNLFAPWPLYKVNGKNLALSELLKNAASELKDRKKENAKK